MRRPRRVSRTARKLLASAFLVAFGGLMIAPIAWVFVTAVMPQDQRFALPPHWIPRSVEFGAFGRVPDLIPVGRMFLNSLEIATIVTAGALITSVLAAYAFARLEFPGRDLLFLLFLSGLMIPQQITVIPVFILMRRLGLVDRHPSVFLPGMVSALGIFLLRQYFQRIPTELDEAARIDGAGHLTILRRIILPLAMPANSALAIFLFQASWNDFFWPNVFLSSTDKLTLPLGLVALRGAHGEGEAVVVFAAITLIVAPLLILFLIFQRPLVESIANTGLK
jgi:multiple sugar transport system permease protein